MTTVAQLRKAALALPEVEESTGSFSVRGKTFASVTDDGWVEVRLSDADAAATVAAHPTAERLAGSARVPLADVDGQQLNWLVRRAWFHRAPQRLAAALADADAGTAPAGSDLPAEIGRPATRALLGAGLSTLDLVATRSADELLALHGVGPKAVRVLAEALAERGSALR
jgi:hypothetical protein